jgi:hypothetical protein
MPQLAALTPVGWPVTVTPLLTVIDPLVPRIGPVTFVEMVWFSPVQDKAALGAPNVASAITEAPASNAARERLAHAAVNGDWTRATL